MTPTDYIWVFIFSTLFVVFNILLFCIIDYIDNKPPGKIPFLYYFIFLCFFFDVTIFILEYFIVQFILGYQTIYDLVLRDTFIMMRITGICFSLIPIFSR